MIKNKKRMLLSCIFGCILFGFSQSSLLAQTNQTPTQLSTLEEYCAITVLRLNNSSKLAAYFDFGNQEDKAVRNETHNEKGLPLEFKTTAEILNHFASFGWTLVSTHVSNHEIKEICYVMKRNAIAKSPKQD